MHDAIVDTGPLVAFLDRSEQHHHWVAKQIEELDPPLLVCEPVLAEALHLLARFPAARKWRAQYRGPDRGSRPRPAQAAAEISGQTDVARRCLRRTDGRILGAARVLTLDSDFLVYRKHGRVPLALL